MPTSAAPLVKAGLFAGLTTLFAADNLVGVIYGPKGGFSKPDIVSVQDVRTDVTPETMGPNRIRDEEHRITIVFAVSRAGPGDIQQTVTERAYALVATMDAWLQAPLGATLAIAGPQLLWAMVQTLDLNEPDTPEAIAKGRQATVTATITARTRI